MFDIVLGICFLLRILADSSIDTADLLTIEDPVYQSVAYLEGLGAFKTYNLSLVYTVIIGCFWFKLVAYIRLSSLLGPLAKMITYMFSDIASFLVLYGV